MRLDATKQEVVHPWPTWEKYWLPSCQVITHPDQEANSRAAEHGSRILFAYLLADGTRIWIITEADRSATTVLLPEEY